MFGLYDKVCRSLSEPFCVYDNPGATDFQFSDELHGRIANLPRVRSIRIPGVPSDPAAAKARVDRLRSRGPPHVTIGISSDAFAAIGLNAGCEVWYSVIGGLVPQAALTLTRTASAGAAEEAKRLSAQLKPLWALFRRHGSIRVVAAAAAAMGLIEPPGLPFAAPAFGRRHPP